MATSSPAPSQPDLRLPKGRKHSPPPCSFTVLKTVDQYEQMIRDPRAAAEAKDRTWEVSPLALVSLACSCVLVLCVLGLVLFVGSK
jgi:hypothetical protein